MEINKDLIISDSDKTLEEIVNYPTTIISSGKSEDGVYWIKFGDGTCVLYGSVWGQTGTSKSSAGYYSVSLNISFPFKIYNGYCFTGIPSGNPDRDLQSRPNLIIGDNGETNLLIMMMSTNSNYSQSIQYLIIGKYK